MKHDWNYRNALRQCRNNRKRYGAAFDETEVKGLFGSMCTFMQKNAFPIDKVLLYFAKGIFNEDVYNRYPKLKELFRGEEMIEVIYEIDSVFNKQIIELDELYKQKLIAFLLPRLECFANTCMIYPEDWVEEKPEDLDIIVPQMIEELKSNKLDTVLKHRRKLYYEL
jgi:hypothetical protein